MTLEMVLDLWNNGRLSTTEAARLLDRLLIVGDCSYETYGLVMAMIKG